MQRTNPENKHCGSCKMKKKKVCQEHSSSVQILPSFESTVMIIKEHKGSSFTCSRLHCVVVESPSSSSFLFASGCAGLILCGRMRFEGGLMAALFGQ